MYRTNHVDNVSHEFLIISFVKEAPVIVGCIHLKMCTPNSLVEPNIPWVVKRKKNKKERRKRNLAKVKQKRVRPNYLKNRRSREAFHGFGSMQLSDVLRRR